MSTIESDRQQLPGGSRDVGQFVWSDNELIRGCHALANRLGVAYLVSSLAVFDVYVEKALISTLNRLGAKSVGVSVENLPSPRPATFYVVVPFENAERPRLEQMRAIREYKDKKFVSRITNKLLSQTCYSQI